MISIIIVDDHQMFIDGIKVLLEKQKDISIVGEALNGNQLLEILKFKSTDIILMDINMPQLDGIEATKIVKKYYPDIKVLMLTMYNTKQYISSMLSAGASGYILKNTSSEELAKAIETIASGESYYSQDVTNKVMESLRKKNSSFEKQPILTKREKDVLDYLAKGLTAVEIAGRLSLSHYTVEAHRKNMLVKFRVHSTIELVRIAIENAWID